MFIGVRYLFDIIIYLSGLPEVSSVVKSGKNEQMWCEVFEV
jgi:hypothetical protein